MGGLYDDIQQAVDDHTDIVFQHGMQRIPEWLLICIIIPDLKRTLYGYTVEVHYEYFMRCSIQLEVETIFNHE